MKIKLIKVGELRTNCYIIENIMSEILIIDPGAEFEKIKEIVGENKVVGILVTHGHYDHIGALEEVCNEYNCSFNEFKQENFKFEVIDFPGHSFDLKSFYFREENIMFTGDFIFKGTFGRVDLPGSDKKQMLESLKKIKKYPEDIILYPGHGSDCLLKYDDINEYINYFL